MDDKALPCGKFRNAYYHRYYMKKYLSLIAGSIAIAACSLLPAKSWDYGYDQICFFNNSAKRCAVNHGYRVPLAKGSNVDIHWEDGQVTTVRYLNASGPLKKSDRVLINGSSSGVVIGIFNNTRGGREIDNYAKVKSSTGNTFAYQYIMD